jgi:CubicO group peptidase (beta-lactamase class C family)
MSTLEASIRHIEHGLVEFTSPSDVFQVFREETRDLHTLPERMRFYNVPGISIAVVQDDEIVWAKAYGVQNIEADLLVTTETLFEAASSTKLLTATIALRLVEKGLFDLDSDINHILKSWKVPEDKYTEEQKVTLRFLLTHQAGINRPEGGFSWEEGSVPSLVQILKGESPAQNHPVQLEFVPGSKWQYSNLGYVIIQLLIEDVLGCSFAEIAQEWVFEPLGMVSSRMDMPPSAEFIETALPHDAEGMVHEQQWLPTAVAHAGLLTTPKDFAIFLIELMQTFRGHSNQILSQAMAHQMLGTELELDPAILGVPLRQGLGAFLYLEGNNLLFLHPGGNEPGANCWPIAAPELGNAAVIMNNGAKGDLLGMEILTAIMREYHWQEKL